MSTTLAVGAPVTPRTVRRRGRTMVVIAMHVALLLVWQAAVDAWHIRPFVLPSPLETLQTLGKTSYAWWPNILVTTAEIFGGFVLALVSGIGLALLFSWSRVLTIAIFPLFVTLNMISKSRWGRW